MTEEIHGTMVAGYIALLAVSAGCYIAAFTFSGLLFIWFNPSGHDCGLNVFFIVMTMILAFGFGIIALHPKVNGSLLPASVISVYCAYLCYSALSSEPRDYMCNGLHNKSKGVSTGTLVLGMLTTVLSVLYSAVRAGSSTTFLSPPSSPKSGASRPLLESDTIEDGKNRKGTEAEAQPVSYSYSFFYLIFALASMYAGMLLTGWTSAQADGSELIDVGWTSVWVRICTEWITAALNEVVYEGKAVSLNLGKGARESEGRLIHLMSSRYPRVFQEKEVGGHPGAQTEKVLCRSSNVQAGRHSLRTRTLCNW
ncbi:hypothetical protein Syun_007646 [Stephania yunnanensis]|uniref:Uncharacterized protein n=1 Tax=Stephania yunnanensis TaxID=152371 RepID=A0AAP0PZI2_9MAGN